MKNRYFLPFIIIFCFALLFCGCSKDVETDQTQNITNADTEGFTYPNTQGEFCRVVCLKGDGIVVWTEEFGYIYVERVDADLGIHALHTVVIEFSENNLKPANGKFTNFTGEELSYSFILENPKSIRRTTPQEPTYG